jgi:hypothetical protein
MSHVAALWLDFSQQRVLVYNMHELPAAGASIFYADLHGDSLFAELVCLMFCNLTWCNVLSAA